MSPDGNLVAFAWSGDVEPGPTDLYVKAVGSEALRQLTATPGSEIYPAWSPDGHSIAFVRDGQGVFTMSQLGGAERQVSASGTNVAWAADSRSILIRDREHNGVPFGIHQVFLATLARRQLTQPRLGPGLMRVPLAGGPEELVFEHVRAFLWSVTDTGIVFVTREPDVDAIDVYRFSDQHVARVGRLESRIPGNVRSLTVSRNGRWALATKRVRFDSDLMLLDNFR